MRACVTVLVSLGPSTRDGHGVLFPSFALLTSFHLITHHTSSTCICPRTLHQQKQRPHNQGSASKQPSKMDTLRRIRDQVFPGN
jgi:hypothetical protein